jgi:hypothetical protein
VCLRELIAHYCPKNNYIVQYCLYMAGIDRIMIVIVNNSALGRIMKYFESSEFGSLRV